MERSVAAVHSHLSLEEEKFSNTIFGFWVYLMTDCVIFITLFTAFGVLKSHTFGGPGPSDLLSVPSALVETIFLLLSSLTCGFATLAATRQKKGQILAWLAVAFMMGFAFVTMEFREFHHLVHEGHSWEKSASLTSFFSLVGTHGLHVSTGLLWMFVLMVQIFAMGVTIDTFRRLVCFNMFWHFLDLIWIFIFTFVYLMDGS